MSALVGGGGIGSLNCLALSDIFRLFVNDILTQELHPFWLGEV